MSHLPNDTLSIVFSFLTTYPLDAYRRHSRHSWLPKIHVSASLLLVCRQWNQQLKAFRKAVLQEYDLSMSVFKPQVPKDLHLSFRNFFKNIFIMDSAHMFAFWCKFLSKSTFWGQKTKGCAKNSWINLALLYCAPECLEFLLKQKKNSSRALTAKNKVLSRWFEILIAQFTTLRQEVNVLVTKPKHLHPKRWIRTLERFPCLWKITASWIKKNFRIEKLPEIANLCTAPSLKKLLTTCASI